MKKNIFSLLLLAITVMAGLALFAGCNKEDTLTPQDFAPPTNFRALSQSGAVVLYWTRSTDDGVSSFSGYRVMTYSGTTKIDSFMTTNDTARITTGMTNGNSYKFKIWSVKSNGDVSVPDSITWGPTVRYTEATIYEFESTHKSGLQLSTGTEFSFNHVDSTSIDVWIDGRGGSEVLLKSPDDYASGGWRKTKFYQTPATITSLDQQITFPGSGAFTSTPGLTLAVGRVYLAQLANGHYARFIISAADLQTSHAPDRYVKIIIAYNTGTGTWAKQ